MVIDWRRIWFNKRLWSVRRRGHDTNQGRPHPGEDFDQPYNVVAWWKTPTSEEGRSVYGVRDYRVVREEREGNGSTTGSSLKK